MKVCFIPIDNRPVCYNLVKDICDIDEDIELYIPPREFLGSLTKYADTEALFDWLKNNSEADCMVLSLDTLAYGGLIPSRRITDSYEQIKQRLYILKPLLENKKVYAFSSIMRISNNNINEEEKEYWKDWGKEIFRYSYESEKSGKNVSTIVPQKILQDYIDTRKRNFDINKLYLEWQKEGLFETLIFSKDDCAEYGFNVTEARQLEILGGKTKTGADEIPLMLLSRAINKDISIFPVYAEEECKELISNYEDVSVEKSVLGQLELGGFSVAKSEDSADIILFVNNFKEKQGELVMGWETEPYNKKFIPYKKPYAVADVRYANGADNNLAEELLSNELPSFGYSAWNTTANTLGSLLASIKIKYKAKKYNDNAYKKLQLIRYLDDWAYQANVRNMIEKPCDIKNLMQPYEDILCRKLKYNPKNISYSHIWNRKFEVEISVE